MSSAIPSDSTWAQGRAKHVFFWIRPEDDENFKVDTGFADAAYSKAYDLRFYRWRELTDEAVRADLVEKAVFSASRAQDSSSIRDPKGYVFTTFTRLVDRYISKEDACSQLPDSDLELSELLGSHCLTSSVEDLDTSILVKQIMAAMTPEDRQIWNRRLVGYEVQEIAAELQISPECLSTRIRRGVNDVLGVLRSKRARQ